MKLLITLLFIIVASTTYRCGKGEDTIDCISATSEMIGTLDGIISYTQPDIGFIVGAPGLNLSYNEVSPASGDSHTFVMKITSTTDCIFIGTIEYGEIENNLNEELGNVSYEINGNIDKYGWVSFVENKFIEKGSAEQICEWGETITGRQECQNWPRGRFRLTGGIYDEGRFTREPNYEWAGEFNLPNSGYWTGSYNTTTNEFFNFPVSSIAGSYQITKR